MGIFEKQYSKIIAEELLRYFLEGKVPSQDVIGDRISKVLNSESGITYQYFSQPNKAVFQVDQYNNALKQIKFDIDLFQEELLDLFGESTRRINFAELYYKIHSYELKNLRSKLESILFSIQNADYYFNGAFDNFSDTSKTNLELSTTSVIDLREGALVLPFGGRNTARISMLHLATYSNWNIQVSVPESIVVEKGQLSGSNFRNIFTDVKASWAYQVITSERTPVSIRFVIPIAGSPEEEAEIFLNRLELTPFSLGRQNIVVKLSNDNVNFFAPLGYEGGITVDDATKLYAMDFETTLTQYVEITFSKEVPDDIIPDPQGGENRYQYVFGLNSFAAYTTGRALNATYISKPFVFDSATSISKISLASNFFRPPGTRVKYQVALSDSDGNPVSNFYPINPMGKEVTSGAPQVLNFKNNNYKSDKFIIGLNNTDETLQYGSVVRGRRLFKLKDRILPSAIFGAIELNRGYGAWARDSSASYTTLSVPNCYVDFSNVDIENLYYITNESPIETNYITNGLYQQFSNFSNTNTYSQEYRRTRIKLNSSPYYIASNGHSIRPSLALQAGQDPTPTFAIYNVKKLSQGASRLKTSSYIQGNIFPQGNIVTNGVIFNLAIADFVINSPDPTKNPILTAVFSAVPNTRTRLVEGLDYDIETVTIDNVQKPTGRVIIYHHAQSILRPVTTPAGPSPTAFNYIIELEYTPEEDITHRVISLNGNELILDHTVNLPGDVYEITYRKVVGSPNEIIRNSVKIYDKPLSDPSSKILREGVDYALNTATGSIRKINTGNIPANGAVYVVYDIKFAGVQLEKFSTWCKIENPDGIEIRFFLDAFSKKAFLYPDYNAGEKLFISTGSNVIEITNALGIPRLAPGWVQFIVFSKNPGVYNLYGTNLINQIIQLKDIDGQRIFREQNKYFNTILAYRDPMIQRTLNHLRVNTLAEDTRSFALDETDRSNPTIVVNFLPNRSKDLYSYGPTSYTFPSDVVTGGSALSRFANPIRIPETYSLTWYYASADLETINNNVIVRIDLEQDLKSDGSITPKIFDYQIRVGF